jgi:hypothetical protein
LNAKSGSVAAAADDDDDDNADAAVMYGACVVAVA